MKHYDNTHFVNVANICKVEHGDDTILLNDGGFYVFFKRFPPYNNQLFNLSNK